MPVQKSRKGSRSAVSVTAEKQAGNRGVARFKRTSGKYSQGGTMDKGTGRVSRKSIDALGPRALRKAVRKAA